MEDERTNHDQSFDHRCIDPWWTEERYSLSICTTNMTGTVVEVELPTNQFALEYTLQSLETVTFEVEQMVATNQDNLMPFIWVGINDCTTIEEAFATDESIAEFQLTTESDTSCLYQLDWVDRINDLIRTLVEENGTILSATAQDNTWYFRLLFADHDAVTRTNEHCKEHGIDFHVQTIQELTRDRQDQYRLSDSQQRTLRLAYDRGYYTIPREATAEDLAEEFGVTHQAISEQLRRGHGHLVEHTLVNGADTLTFGQVGQSDGEEPSLD